MLIDNTIPKSILNRVCNIMIYGETVFELMGGLGGFNPPSSSDPTIVTPPTSQVLGLLAVLLTPPVHFSQFEHCGEIYLCRDRACFQDEA